MAEASYDRPCVDDGRRLGAAALALLGPLAATSTTPPAFRLAADLKALYAAPGSPGERWGHGAARVTLADGTKVARESAYRDHPEFVAAASLLLASRDGDDAPLGAWLLSTLPTERAAAAEPVLIDALRQEDRRAAFEAARGLGRIGGAGCLPALRATQRSAASPKSGPRRPGPSPGSRRATKSRGGPGPARSRCPRPFAAGSRGGSKGRKEMGERGRSSELAALGVGWVSIHTWEPRQKALDGPDFTPANARFGLRDLTRPRRERARRWPARALQAAPRDARVGADAARRSRSSAARTPPRSISSSSRPGRKAGSSWAGTTRSRCAPTRTGRHGSSTTASTSSRTPGRPRPRGPTCSAWAASSTGPCYGARPTGAISFVGSAASTTAPSPTRPTSTPTPASGSGTRSISSASPPTSA